MPYATHAQNHLFRLARAIESLQKDGYIETALMLTYAGIDQMAWLSVEKEETNSTEFKIWVNKYISLPEIGCTSNDLWGARCALLHTGSAESREFKKDKAKKIFYLDGNVICSENKDQEVIFIHATNLLLSFIFGATSFIHEMESNPEKIINLEKKAGSILKLRKVE